VGEIGVIGQSDTNGPQRDRQCQEREGPIKLRAGVSLKDIDAYAHI
jgi:hypothetical protein